MRLDSSKPVRVIKPGSRGIRGKVASTGVRSTAHESLLERDWFVSLAFDRRVKGYVEQPFTLKYELDGKQRSYTPDVRVEYEEGGRLWTVVYEVKYRDELLAHWNEYRPRYKAAVAYCRARGWRFKLITECQIRGPQMDNIRFLRRYRHLPAQPFHSAALFQALKILGPTTPQALLAAAWYDQEKQMAALAELWRLIAVGEICAHLSRPLTMTSPIWSCE